MKFFLKITALFAILSFFPNQHVFSRNNPVDTSLIIINKIIIVGNNKTKSHIIKRELLFSEGDTLNRKDKEEVFLKTKESLFNTSLFNFISVSSIDESPSHSTVYILVEERWYLWPYPILEYADRNFSSFLHEKDWSRINYGLMVTKYNFRGRRETIKVKARFGYKQQFQFYYNNPYIFNSKKHGIAIEFSWYRQYETPVITLNDELQFYRDSNQFAKKYHTSYLSYKYRNLHYTSHQITLGYTYTSVLDTVAIINPNHLGNGNSKTEYFSLKYNFSHDKRDYKFYPLTGYNINAFYEQKGLGLLQNELPGIWAISLSGYKYIKFKKRLYSGVGARTKISKNTNQPFIIQKALGYGEYLRAYEYYVIDGQYNFTTRFFIKYAIIPMNIQKISSLGWKKFNKIHYSLYVNAFFDSGYVRNNFNHESNKLPNQYLYSGGIGIDIVAYYDQIIRFEYSINKEKESGFFIHIGKAF